MAKKKNHTNHNQNKKNHRNGIKKVLWKPIESKRGVNQKLLQNMIYAKKYNNIGRAAYEEKHGASTD